jgi:hypothetical protein
MTAICSEFTARSPSLIRAPARDGLDRVVVLDPADDSVRARFTVEDGCAGCCGMDDGRLLLVEGRALVSRAIDGGDRRAHARLALGPNESVLQRAAAATARSRSCAPARTMRASRTDAVRVYDLETGACVATVALEARCELARIAGKALVVGVHTDAERFELRATALASGQRAWSRTFDSERAAARRARRSQRHAERTW